MSGALVVLAISFLVGVGILASDRRVSGAWAQFGEAARSPTWAAVTDGRLQDAHRGTLITFWGAARLSRRGSMNSNWPCFVCVDAIAIVVVARRVFGPPKIAIQRRADAGQFRLTTRPTFMYLFAGPPAMVDDRTGLCAVWPRHLSIDEVHAKLEALGWSCYIADAPRVG